MKKRKEDDERTKEYNRKMNQLRIEQQHATNQFNKQRTMRSIDHARTTVYTNSTNSRENMNAFLRTNYEKFFSERNEEQKFKSLRAAEMYNERMEAQRKLRFDRHNDYAYTAHLNNCEAFDNQQLRVQTESDIKKLEEQEQQLLKTMQTTLQVKQQLVNELASKSKMLRNRQEPRNAYRLTSIK